MPDRRMISLDGWALGFAAVGIAIALCIIGKDEHTSSNWLGEPGRGLARELTDALGSAVFIMLAGWAMLTIHLVLKRNWGRWAARIAGWTMLLFAGAVAADWAAIDIGPGPMTVGGGSVGAWLAAWLASSFTPAGQVALVVIAFAFGAFLATEYFVVPTVRGLGWLFRRTLRIVRRAASFLRSSPEEPEPVPLPRRRAAQTARDDGIPIVRLTPPEGQDSADDAESPPPEAAASEVPAAPLRIVRPGPAPDTERFQDYELPPLTLLEEPQPFPYDEHDQHLRDQAVLLEKTFKDFELNVRVVGINTGPVITQYEVALQTGLRVYKVTCLADDLALNMRVPSVRMVAPIPGKNTVGIEIPNEHRAIVRLKEVLQSAGKKSAKHKIPLFLGKDSEGRPLVFDLAEMPHLLIAGRTGTGKSVCLNSIILSMLMTRRPDELKMILIDPKRTELIEYGRLPHLMHPVVTDAKKAEAILAWAVDKMEERYELLSRARVRSIAAYNELSPAEIYRRLQPATDEDRAAIPLHMPYVVLIVDELGDLMMQMKREIEGHIIRLAQKSRAAGIHLIVATQKPTVDVITGLIKSNLPARICFQVSSRSDSRVVLDEMGADKLLGKGDMLFLLPGTGNLLRAQGAFASDSEITGVVEHLDCEPCFEAELMNLKSTAEESAGEGGESQRPRDPLYDQAISIVLREGRGSVSLLQRSLGIGYGRAARLIDFMAEDGIVGGYNGSNAREVMYTPEQWQQAKQTAV
jgi:S-DNA-T family DNA segregation ATPase FtsK/SpoIIIE